MKQLLEGSFYEGATVTVALNDKVIKRKVWWDNEAKDLCIIYKGLRYWASEFYN